MAKKPSKVRVQKSEKPKAPSTELRPFEWPGRALQGLHEEIDRLFEDFPFGLPVSLFGRRPFELDPFRRFERALAPVRAVTPSVDVTENDKEVTVTAEIPGLDEKDIEVVLSDDLLTIKGEKREEQEEKKKDYYVMERRYGSFQRSFRLPDTVDRDKIDASFVNGLLTIHAPKIGKAKKAAKKIAIKTN
jgi:HSP20 family protein